MPFGLMFHYFHEGGKHLPAQGSISSDQLEHVIDRFTSDARVLRAEEWADKAENGRLAHSDVCLTFDDALRSQFDIALPVLRRRGLTAFWFVQSGALTGEGGMLEACRRFRNEHFPSPADFYSAFYAKATISTGGATAGRINAAVPDDYLQEFRFYTAEDRKFRFVRDKLLQPREYVGIMTDLMHSMNTSVEELSARMLLDKECLQTLESEGNIIGLHSHSHPTCLAALSKNEQRAEYETNYQVLREILVEPPFTMSHPCNSYSADTLEILRGLGIRIGFCSNMKIRNNSSLEFPRMDCVDLITNVSA